MINAVGFYWTLPVPWTGFTALPADIDGAARASRTIRYQRELIRRHSKMQNYRVIMEEVFLEIAPDRGSHYIREPLRKIEGTCREHAAVLLYVDFSEVQGWRSHAPLADWARRTHIRVETVFPDEILIDGELFDPQAHFSKWRARQHAWAEGKDERIDCAYRAAQELRAKGRTYRSIAEELNNRLTRSATGKPWTEENIRKLLQKS